MVLEYMLNVMLLRFVSVTVGLVIFKIAAGNTSWS